MRFSVGLVPVPAVERRSGHLKEGQRRLCERDAAVFQLHAQKDARSTGAHPLRERADDGYFSADHLAVFEPLVRLLEGAVGGVVVEQDV